MNAIPLTEPVYELRPWTEDSDFWRWYSNTPKFLGHVAGIDFWLTGSSKANYITFRWADDRGRDEGWGGFETHSLSFRDHSELRGNPEALEFCRILHQLHS